MVNAKKTQPNREGLEARGQAEAKSPQAHAVFAEVCARLSTKQIGDIAGHRILNGSRPVTRDILVKAMKSVAEEFDAEEPEDEEITPYEQE